MITRIFRLIFLTVLIALAARAHAGAIEETDLGLYGQVSAVPLTKVDGAKGKTGWSQAGFSIAYSYFTFNYQARAFSWAGKQDLPFGNKQDAPWESLTKIGLNFRYTDMGGGKWGYFTGGGLISAFEEETCASWAGWAYGGVILSLSPVWQVRAGAVGSLDHVDAQALPMLSLDYNQGSALGWSFSLGIPETDIHYGFTPRLGVRLNFSFDQFTYRLADNSTVMKKGYLRQQEAVAGLRLEYRPIERLLLTVGPEYHFMGKFILYDRDGDKYDDYSLEPSLGASFGLEYHF